MRISDIFKVGGLPNITYIPREKIHLEKRLHEAIEDRHKIISISGSTKTGKTVLCKTVICENSAIWISGAEVSSIEDFWNSIISKLEIPLKISEAAKISHGGRISGSLTTKISGILASISGTAGAELSANTEESHIIEKIGRFKEDILHFLIESNIILIIDDFHYIITNIQKEIVRSLKNPIFNGLVVIIISIPHHANDVIASERELTGRITQIEIPFWSKGELSLIAKNGFNYLNLKASDTLISLFSEEAFGNPHLMQEFCLKLCRDNNINDIMDNETEITLKTDPEIFFHTIAETSTSSHPAYTKLVNGPRQRRKRINRAFIDGTHGDIYFAMLYAILKAGPKKELSYWDIRDALGLILVQIPKSNEISRILSQMTSIANEIEGEPILEWDKENQVLYILDPFFAYYIKWKSTN